MEKQDNFEEKLDRLEDYRENPEEKLDTICDILDKLTLDTLFLMEKEIEMKLNVENSMCQGESHLAKARYIMGQNNVSSIQLPTENTPEFSAALKVHSEESSQVLGGKSYDLVAIKKTEDQSVVDPMRWFGLLVPLNLSHAQTMFKQALQWTVQAANVQSQLTDMMKILCGLKQFKSQYKDELVMTK
ncbi:unnamed protein product [Phaedon cochleariae]|uniref:Vacuolar ATPase assembly protein VMA22 n=1 Tax=Phaedon cochleariae TaxID=80249 RepID=A0A9N9SBU7_PHACE|nr:unnamed protein product [Phaedon cochleariae]